MSFKGKTSANVLYITRYNPLKIGTDDVGSSQWWRQLNRGADVITGLSRRHPCWFSYLVISTCLSCKAQIGLRVIFIQKFKPKYAYLPSKIIAVWIDRFCVRYDWWRRLQPMSSVSPVCACFFVFFFISFLLMDLQFGHDTNSSQVDVIMPHWCHLCTDSCKLWSNIISESHTYFFHIERHCAFSAVQQFMTRYAPQVWDYQLHHI